MPAGVSLKEAAFEAAVRPSAYRPCVAVASECVDIERLSQTFADPAERILVLCDRRGIDVALQGNPLDEVARGSGLGHGLQDAERKKDDEQVREEQANEAKRRRARVELRPIEAGIAREEIDLLGLVPGADD